MRIDVDQNGASYDVLLDGEPVPRCVMADEELGVVEVIDLDHYGLPILYPEGPRGVQTRMRWGKVECFLKSDRKAEDPGGYAFTYHPIGGMKCASPFVELSGWIVLPPWGVPLYLTED